MSATDHAELLEDLLAGKHRALARVITKIENREPGYRDLVSALHAHTGHAEVIGITGSPGAGKSTLVDKLAKRYRDRGETVGVIAVDPSSPYTGGAVLGDRIRMASNVGDMDVFFRSMSARGQLGGLSTATADAVKALDAFGKDKIVIETVGAGQNEVDIVKTADTVAVLVPPGSGDDVQALKAGILEIGDVFVVNKADLEGADRTVQELEEMIHMRQEPLATPDVGHHAVESFDVGHRGAESVDTGHRGAESIDADRPPAEDREGGRTETAGDDAGEPDAEPWTPTVLETVATTGEGLPELLETLEEHREYLERTGRLRSRARTRYAEEIRQLVRNDAAELLAEEIDRQGGIDDLADRVLDREVDPYTIADEIVEPLAECVRDRRE